MNRVAQLIEAADEIRRRLWASIPWGIRVAELFMRLAVSPQEAFGQGVLLEFEKVGVTGLPAKHGRAFPSDIARDIGRKAYGIAMSVTRSPTKAEDVLSSFYVRLLKGGSHGLAGKELHHAEQSILMGVKNEAINLINFTKRRKDIQHSDVRHDDEGGESHVEAPVFHSLEDIEHNFPRDLVMRELPQMHHELERIHQDAPLYVKMVLLDGMQDKEIVGDPKHGKPSKLPHPVNKRGDPLTPQSWDMTYKPQILQVLKKHFDRMELS